MSNDLITGQRTFVKGIGAVADGGIVNVAFTDSAGNNMKCSYFRLQAVCKTASKQGAVIAELSGVSMEGNMTTDALSALPTSPAASGILGIGLITNIAGNTTSEWHGSNGQVCTGVKLQVDGDGGTTDIVITYGNLFPLNVLRLEQSYDAGA